MYITPSSLANWQQRSKRLFSIRWSLPVNPKVAWRWSEMWQFATRTPTPDIERAEPPTVRRRAFLRKSQLYTRTFDFSRLRLFPPPILAPPVALSKNLQFVILLFLETNVAQSFSSGFL